MTTVTYRLAELANITLNLGWTGENETKTFIIDCKKVFDDYPNATPALRVYPPQGDAYPATVTKDGDNVVWVIKDSDLVYSGKGEIQLTFTEGGKVKKSVRAKTQTDESIPAGGTAPDPVQDWIDDAEAVLDALDGLEVTAETLDPDESATAEVSEDPDDGHRIIAFGIPQGVQGETGATPDISIGTVTTGAAGSDAEVEVTGTAEEPVLNFTIPQGLKGDAGNGDMLAPAYSTSATYKVGDYVTYNGGLYCCKTAITTAEAWTAAHWTSTNFGKDCSALKSAITLANNGYEVIKGTFAHGSVNSTTGVMTESSNNYKYRVVTPAYITYDRDVTIRCASGYQFQAYWYDNTDALVGKMASFAKEYKIAKNTRFRLYVLLDPNDTSANVDPSVFQNNIYVESVVGCEIIELGNGLDDVNNKIKASNNGAELLETTLEHGRILTTSGHVGEVSVSENNYKYFAVTPNAVSFSTPKKIRANTGYSVQVWWYDNSDAYVGRSANFVSEYSLNANTKYRFFMSNDPLDTTASIDVETFRNNVYLISALGERVEAIETKPLTTLPDYMLKNMAEKPLGILSKGYILLSFDDGAKTLATGTIPLLIENEVPGSFGLLPQSEIFAEGNESELATVVDAVENHGCVVAMHGSAQWPTYTESALNAYFDSTIALFIDSGLGDTYGAICPGGNSDDTSALVKAVAGGKFGYVFSGNRVGKISYDAANADGKYNGARSNRFDLDRRSGIGITTAKVQAIVNYAAENHLLLCPFWHDNTLNDENHPEYITYFNALITAAKDAGLTFITTKDLPNIT